MRIAREMNVVEEISLRDFDFCGYAAGVAALLTPEELDQIEDIFSPSEEGYDATAVNELFYYYPDFIAECVGYANYDEMEQDRVYKDLQ